MPATGIKPTTFYFKGDMLTIMLEDVISLAECSSAGDRYPTNNKSNLYGNLTYMPSGLK